MEDILKRRESVKSGICINTVLLKDFHPGQSPFLGGERGGIDDFGTWMSMDDNALVKGLLRCASKG